MAELLEWEQDLGTSAASTPEDAFTEIRSAGRLQEAAFFLGQALPRLESVAWAAGFLRDMPVAARTPAEADAIKSALLWVQDPTEQRRRNAFASAQAAPEDSPGRLVALAAFFSGGSIAPEDCPAVSAPRNAAGRFAAGALLLAASRQADHETLLQRALDIGSAIATHGLDGADTA